MKKPPPSIPLSVLLMFASCAAQHLEADSRTAQKADVSDGLVAAEAFWQSLSRARVDELASHYALEVTVLAGSEVLKPEWGLATKRSRDIVVSGEALAKAYGRMIAKIGADRWTDLFTSLPADGHGVTLEERAGRPVACMSVRPGEDDDRFLFYLRETGDGWKVFEERADY